MAVTLPYICAISVTLVLLVYTTPVVHGSTYCPSSSIFEPPTFCQDYEVCCGINKNTCCVKGIETPLMSEVLSLLFLLFLFVCCPVICYRCCCRRTTNRGAIYHPAVSGTSTSVTVSLPPAANQQVPYPTVVPYPQQTPYPPQYPTNPYYGLPPPPYGVAMQGENLQQASAPSAPYPHYPTS